MADAICPNTSSNISPARMAALAVLEKLRKTAKTESGDKPLPALLDEQCRRLNLDSRDAGLATELVCGVLRAESRLQLVLQPFVRKPDSLPAGMRELLLMAAYELLKLDTIPARATLHQSVSLARKRFGAGMAGLANAVLRALNQTVESGEAQSIFVGAIQNRNAESMKGSTAKSLAEAGSLPLWLAKMWLEQYGDAAWTFAENAGLRALPSFRLNARLATAKQDALRQTLAKLGGESYGAYGFLFPETLDNVLQTSRAKLLVESESAGELSRQGLGSQAVVAEIVMAMHRYGCSLSAPLWDACCGRGGKTCGLLEQGVNVQLASDPSSERLAALQQNLHRLHLSTPRLEHADITTLAPSFSTPATMAVQGHHTPAVGGGQHSLISSPSFPLILIDAPCSGTGTLARNPELRLRLTPKRLADAVRLQASIVEDAWNCLADNGLLFYATCALNKAENEGQVATLSARHAEAVVLEQGLRLIDAPGGHDALFLAIVRKNES